MMKSKKNSGQVLIEAIVALAVVAFVLVGIVAALIAAVNNSTFAKNQNLATNFAQEGIDFARDIKESDFITFSAYEEGIHCLDSSNKITDKSAENNCNITDTIFIREIYINSQGEDARDLSAGSVIKCESGSIFVATIVSWNDSRCDGNNSCHDVELDSCFSDLGSSSI